VFPSKTTREIKEIKTADSRPIQNAKAQPDTERQKSSEFKVTVELGEKLSI